MIETETQTESKKLTAVPNFPYGPRYLPVDPVTLVAPYMGSKDHHINTFLELVGPLSEDDIVLDLGCGDGRVCHEAAKSGCKAVGIDVDIGLLDMARDIARDQGVGSRCTFKWGDFMRNPDVARKFEPSVVYVWLLPQAMEHLNDILWYRSDFGTENLSEISKSK